MAKFEIQIPNNRIAEFNRIAVEIYRWEPFRPVAMTPLVKRVINRLRGQARASGQAGTEYSLWVQGGDNIPDDIVDETQVLATKAEVVILGLYKQLAEQAVEASDRETAKANAAAVEAARQELFESMGQ